MSQTLGTDAETQLAHLLQSLDGMQTRPLVEHPAAYEQVHVALRRTLAGEPVASAG